MPRTSVKSPDAFRTISEAADALDLPQHVLRFWETRFSQIKPMKRSGGRRYYRPTDIALLQGIRHLLYDEGYTIKGVQRILREQGIAHVAGLGASRAAAATVNGPAPTKSGPATPSSAAPGLAAPDPTASVPAEHQGLPNAAPASPQPSPGQLAVGQPSASQSPALHMDPVQQALTGPSHLGAHPGDHAGATPAQPSPAAPSAQSHAVAPQLVPQQPVPHLPVQHQPVSAPTTVQPQREPQTPEAPTFPPLGSLGGSSSSLRFMPDAEAPPAPAVLEETTHLPVQHAAPVAETPLAPPATSAQSPATNGQPHLSPEDTETLVKALRTLLDCKAILDSSRQPTSKPNSTNS